MVRVANQFKTRTSEMYTEIDLTTGIPMSDTSVDFLVSSFGSAGEVHPDIISEVNRVLKPGGKAWLSFYNKDAFAHIWWQP
jgi:ubiquinone/menaquinone biosynthesis C-methylase UbiE